MLAVVRCESECKGSCEYGRPRHMIEKASPQPLLDLDTASPCLADNPGTETQAMTAAQTQQNHDVVALSFVIVSRLQA